MTILEQLLAALNGGGNSPLPAPAKPLPFPVKTVPTPNLGMPVEPAQEVPQAPLDTSIINRYMAAAGPAPTAPAQRRPGKLETIGNVLLGVGAGFDGSAPQFLQYLDDRYNRPQREYQAQLRDYNDRQANLRLRGIDAAERDQERQTERAQRLEDQQYARRYAAESRRLGLVDDESRARLAHSLELERDAIRASRAEAAELEREQRRRQDDARSIAGRLSVGPGAAPPEIAKELGEYQANLRDSLSPAAAKWRSAQVRRMELLANGGVGGGSGGGTRSVSNAAMKALANFNGALQEVIGAIQRADDKGEQMARRKLDAMYGRLSQFPGQIEAGIGTGGWPYAKLINAAPAQAAPQQQQQSDPLGILR